MLDSLKASVTVRSGVERAMWVLLLLFVFAICFSIAVSHILLTAAVILYFIWRIRGHRPVPRPALLMPALVFSYCTLLSVLFSIDPYVSLLDARELALFILIPIFYEVIRDLDDVRGIYGVLIFAGVISAAYGLFQFFGSEAEFTTIRIKGFMGHWMTFSGLLMILNVLLLSHLLFSGKHSSWFYPAFALLSLSLLLSLTRSAWLGFLAASFVLIAMRKVRWVFAIPAVVLIIFLASVLIFPSVVAARMSSIFNPDETSNKDRLLMARSGWQIIQDYPLTGVGNDMIKRVYPRYRAPDSPHRTNPHLHNNLIQLAAENGIIAVLVWLWFVGRILYDLWHWKRSVMNPEEMFMIHGTIGIVISLFVAGMFEYNFGDSEIKMLFLLLVSIPYGWHKTVENLNRRTEKWKPETIA